ncbi:outer membrane beta-barrel protein [Altererythrobacter xixiisoli]|uniref:Outer membrane beta-barrel protein n=1 Tax=Croceibacterium xixiisoli TaxID=1476466 RepID=A0A6I4TVB4_9SPHN|nr:outer membrane beta-barrel protein [Croceibacterium xixiisoli]MXO99131.1 outer membrane beta-barrel protein [Croceibacterium xixiisoli]
MIFFFLAPDLAQTTGRYMNAFCARMRVANAWRESAALAAIAGSLWAPAVSAQDNDSLLIQPVVPPGFGAGRDVPVREQPRKDYDAVGMAIGSFRLFPRVSTGAEFSSNAYQNASNTVAAPVITAVPSLDLRSNWNRHDLRLHADGSFYKYIGEGNRDEANWLLSASSRFDATKELSFNSTTSIAQITVNRFSGDVFTELASVSSYRRNYTLLGARYAAGRAQITLNAEHLDLHFNPLKLLNGSELSQEANDRSVTRLNGQIEYAFSPSVAVFSQISGSKIEFDTPVGTSIARANSNGVRVLAGTRVDFVGLARATIAAGYTLRDYDDNNSSRVDGLSAEMEVLVFPSALTTLTFRATRRLADSRIIDGLPFFVTDYSAGIDHAVRRNLLLEASVRAFYQNYVSSSLRARSFIANTGVTYLVSPKLEFGGFLNYSQRVPDRSSTERRYSEIRTGVEVTFKR